MAINHQNVGPLTKRPRLPFDGDGGRFFFRGRNGTTLDVFLTGFGLGTSKPHCGQLDSSRLRRLPQCSQVIISIPLLTTSTNISLPFYFIRNNPEQGTFFSEMTLPGPPERAAIDPVATAILVH